MRKISKLISKIIVAILIVSFSSVQTTYAQGNDLQSPGGTVGQTSNSETVTGTSLQSPGGLNQDGTLRSNDDGSTVQGGGSDISQAASGAAACAIGGILGSLFGSTAGAVDPVFESSIKRISGGAAAAAAGGGGTIAVIDVGTHAGLVGLGTELQIGNEYLYAQTVYTEQGTGELIKIRRNTGYVSKKETGKHEGLGGGGFGNQSSLDGIAFCIANEMIQYIGDATIQWINSGFKGKPVFVDNPERYFQNIADQEAGAFVQQLVGGATGINVCEPFKVQLAIDTIGSHNSSLESNRRSQLNCSLSSIADNYEQFTGGDWNAGGRQGWFELIQPQNNIYGARQLANKEALISVTQRQNTATLNLNLANGYRDFSVCDKERSDGSCETGFQRKTTLGGYIEHTINTRADSPQHRLEVADEFDEIVSALVNQLIKVAVNQIFDSGGQGQ